MLQTQQVHEVTLWPKIYMANEWATCTPCAGFIQRRKYERLNKWRARLTTWRNKHAPFVVDDRSHDHMEAR